MWYIITCDGLMNQMQKLALQDNIILRKYFWCLKEVKLQVLKSWCYCSYCNAVLVRYKGTSINTLRVCHKEILKRVLRR